MWLASKQGYKVWLDRLRHKPALSGKAPTLAAHKSRNHQKHQISTQHLELCITKPPRNDNPHRVVKMVRFHAQRFFDLQCIMYRANTNGLFSLPTTTMVPAGHAMTVLKRGCRAA